MSTLNTSTAAPETTLPAPADTDPWANASDSSGAVTPWDAPAASATVPRPNSGRCPPNNVSRRHGRRQRD